MRERVAGCRFVRVFGVDEGQEQLEETLHLFSSRTMVRDLYKEGER